MKKDEEKEKDKISRRSVLKGAVALGVAAAAGNVGLRFGEAQAATPPKKWDREVDVLVVGGGGAGLAAALSAHEPGAKVLLIEKAPTFNLP